MGRQVGSVARGGGSGAPGLSWKLGHALGRLTTGVSMLSVHRCPRPEPHAAPGTSGLEARLRLPRLPGTHSWSLAALTAAR